MAEAPGDPKDPPLGSPPSCGSHPGYPTQKNNGPRSFPSPVPAREGGGMGYRRVSRGKRAQQLVLDLSHLLVGKRLDGEPGVGGFLNHHQVCPHQPEPPTHAAQFPAARPSPMLCTLPSAPTSSSATLRYLPLQELSRLEKMPSSEHLHLQP